ncbi:dicarboxylate/amino acid:cation symporter [Rothia nasimurium]|uniref:Dicarboxylate/amino acid:cation symporter n=1 Tax=Rothia nasimurium TaxID=85336 RepID=A0A4Y9F8K0_9MICC|nr:dicarboxylate/amino acid:cation symporter [Rothia nasimurium]MBF0807076.1 dicarboxylate/amino acid:cation symporter [Rothia nasimurium]TFU24396.1 dicarboxylate/amino acid:cation symporter [Rothia nasimurium]
MSNHTTALPTRKRLPAWATSFGNQIIAALILGVILGLVATNLGGDATENPNWLMTTLSTIGSSYVTLLKAAVVPLIFTAVVSSIANLAEVSNAARLATKTLLWFAYTALIAVLIGLVLGLVTQPGANTGLATPETYEGRTGSWLGFLTGLIPANFLGLGASISNSGETVTGSASFNVLQILVISVAVGIAALKTGPAAKPFLDFNKSALAIIQTVLWWIIRLAPLGTVGLIGQAVYAYGWTSMGSLARFVIVLYIGLALVLFVVYPAIARANGLSIKQFFSGVWPAVQMGFVSRSSMGTMPLTQSVAERNFGVPRAYASFAVPLGSTTKMDGCAAVYPALAALFVAQFYGIDLNITHYLLIIMVSVLGSTATAGTTGATVMLTLTLSTLGLPLDGIGLLLAIDPIIDMGRTAVNVAGQALVALIIAKREGILNEDLYNAPRTEGGFVAEDVYARLGEAPQVPAAAAS